MKLTSSFFKPFYVLRSTFYIFLTSSLILLTSSLQAATPTQSGSKNTSRYNRSAIPAKKAVNTWNRWKKPIAPRDADGSMAEKDPEMPWTLADVRKLDSSLSAKSGGDLFISAYNVLKKKYSPQRCLNWLEYILLKQTDFTLNNNDRRYIANLYGFNALQALDHARMLQSIDILKKYNATPTSYLAYRGLPAIPMYEALVDFPRDPDSIVFPTENIWAKGNTTVHAKDFGFDSSDSTAAIMKAFGEGDVVILDKMPYDWKVSTIKPPPGKSLILEKGVKILAESKSAQANSKIPLFDLKGVRDFYLEGKGGNYIGKYASDSEREKFTRDYGGDGFVFDDSHNIVIRNVEIANCGDDGIVFSGIRVITSEVYLENLTLRHNYRQAMSVCNADGVYIKNCSFLDTIGGQPMAGVDFEPSIQEVQATSRIYFMDCKFKGNAGADVCFSESSVYPVTVLFKGCEFGPHMYGSIRIQPLCGLYMGNGTDAPSDIIFEDCKVNGYSWVSPFILENANLFHVTIRGGEIVQDKSNKPVANVSPIDFHLGREYYYGFKKKREAYSKEGSFAIDGLKVTGWKGNNPISFTDSYGHIDVKQLFGKFTMNGRPVDMKKFVYEGPDFARADCEGTDLGPDEGLTGEKAEAEIPGVPFDWKVPWYQTPPHYVKTAAGHFKCVNSGGVYRFKEGAQIYFDVPAGKGDVELKLTGVGTVELLRGDRKVLETYTKNNMKNGAVYVKLRQVAKPQKYGLRAVKGTMTFKFFAPFSGEVYVK